MSEDFWDEMQGAFGVVSSIEEFLEGTPFEGQQYTSVRELSEQQRSKHALLLPVDAGARVRFMANLGSVLTYPDVPGTGVEGTVVTVRTAGGDATSDAGKVFVVWDDGKFRSVFAQYLRPSLTNRKQARSILMVVADIGELSAFFTPAPGGTALREVSGGDDLVHKATKDLWSFRQEGEQYVIERLFTESGDPLKA